MDIEGFTDLVEIYNGHQSKIYKGFKKGCDIAVTLKIPANEFPEQKHLSALGREHRILNALSGKGIPTPHGFLELKNSAVLVREWIEGQSLRAYQQQRDLTLEQALEIGAEISRILSLVHRQNFCHRDISPSNVIIGHGGEVSLIDFCSSIEFPDRARNIVKPLSVEGSRPYMSPEQTGRMNCGLDYRTDFYSLGVLLYELFTGHLPFSTKDTNELIYSHIALDPEPLFNIKPSLPSVVSDIVIKLMSKSPNDRYQSAEGIQADLSYCLASIRKSGTVEPFELGANDLNDRLIIPDKIYGRDNEVNKLLESFHCAADGEGQLVFVSGHSGIGKTSLIRELYKPLTSKGGYITNGKYDQLLRHQPYSAFTQAITRLIRQIMSEGEDSIQPWKKLIVESLGANGQVLIDILPDLELLIGPQPNVPALSTEAASTRFNTTFFNLVSALGKADKPLVLFIDDLQWIDPPSLSLLETLAPSLNRSNLMVIGAYRDNEVLEHHPLMISMPSLKHDCKNVIDIQLKELAGPVIGELLRDTIELTTEDNQQLNQVLCDRTGGNPLIYKTMLSMLYSKGSIFFNYVSKHWDFHWDEIHATPPAENSIAMLQSNMVNLAVETLDLLKSAACVGNTFNLELLSGLSQQPKSSVAVHLIPAVSQGYIQPLDDHFELNTASGAERLPDIQFAFSHDRIQQAAYSLLSDEQCEEMHWVIGRYLLNHSDQSGDHLFDLVEHLNQGCQYATANEKTELVELNLKAAKSAKKSAAFTIAHSCLVHAKDLLTELGDNPRSQLSTTVDLELAQACYLVGEFDNAEQLYTKLRDSLTSEQDKLQLYNIQAKQYHHQGLYQKSVEFEYEALRLLGISLPDDDQSLLELFGKEKTSIEALLDNLSIEDIFHQSDNEDPKFSLTHELLFDAFTDGYLLGKGPLLAAVAAISTRLSLQQGNCNVTSAGLINYATVLCSSGEYRLGHRIGQLAIRLADKYQSPVFKNYTYHVFSLGINHWLEPLKSSYYYWYDASKLSLESGSPYAGWVFLQMPHVLLASGDLLDNVAEQSAASLDYLTSNHLTDVAQLLKIIVLQPLKHLRGETPSFSSLDDDNFSTAQLMEEYQNAPFFLGHTVYSVLRASLLAKETIPTSTLKEWLPLIENTVQAQIIQVDSYLYTGLHLATNIGQLAKDERDEQLAWLDEIIAKFEAWAELCPYNFKHKYLLLKAERFRLSKDVLSAFDHYELARECALESRFLFDAALADECAGLFWQDAGKPYQAQSYLTRALEGYEQWGAKGKVQWLRERYPSLINQKTLSSTAFNVTLDSTLGTEDFSSILDMGSVLKASQAVSQHINMDTLAEELLNLAVENAGATRGLLLLETGGEFIVTQKVTVDDSSDDKRGLNTPYSKSHCLSRSIVRYVINAKTHVLYTPNEDGNQFERCPYLENKDSLSVLCVPIIRQNKLSGVLYLENNHTAQAFQADRVQTLNIIASQAAISLENARMFSDLEQMNNNLEGLVQERTKELYQANEQLRDTNKALYQLSTTDQLTGLYNRRYAEETLTHALTQLSEHNEPLSLLMLDVDNFKSINDQFGHSSGDHILKNVSHSIKHSISSEDTPARWGGEEFLIVCKTNIEAANISAEKIGRVIAEQDNSPAHSVTVSIGVTPALYSDTIDSLLSRVDKALYEAKNNGRNQVVIRLK